jgi:hypothetical protein
MSVLDQLNRHESRASALRTKLGLDPAGYAKIAKDVVFTGPVLDDALERAAAKGREIMERREAELRTATAAQRS